MTDIIISFDTEDFTSSHAADAIRDTARLLTSEGVRANYCMVGLLAKQLVAWGRTDVLDALKNHEIASHTYGHSLHPNISEYTDLESFDDAYAECRRQESEALALIGGATGVGRVYAAVPPGNCKSYVAMYTYADLGIPIYADTVCDTADGQGVYYCNMLNIQYVKSFESMFYRDCDIDALLDSLATRRRAVLYNHPNCILYSDYWDILNYDKVNMCAFGEWREGKRRDPAQVAEFYRRLREFIVRLKNDSRFRIVTYSQTAEAEAARGERVILRSDIPEITGALNRSFGQVCLRGRRFSVAEINLACAAFLRGADSFTPGKSYGFLSVPYAIRDSVTVGAREVIAASGTIPAVGFLPTEYMIGSTSVGPADLLFAMLGVLGGQDKVTLTPRSQLSDTSALPALAGFRNRGTWRHADSYRDEYLSERLRLQCWTMRFS